MKYFLAIFLNIIVSLFMFVGYFFVYKLKNNKKLIDFFVSFGLITLILLDFFYVLPNAITLLNLKFVLAQSYSFLFLVSLLSYGILKLVTNNTKIIKNSNLFEHTIYLLLIVLFIYYIVEGIEMYTITLTSFKKGLVELATKGLYNISIGVIISGFLSNTKIEKKYIIKIVLYLILSSFIGSLLAFTFNINITKSFVLGTIISFIFGMISYIIIIEIWPKFRQSNGKKLKALGLVIGGLIMLLTTLF